MSLHVFIVLWSFSGLMVIIVLGTGLACEWCAVRQISVQGEPDCGTLGGGDTSSSICPWGEKDAILECRQVWGARP